MEDMSREFVAYSKQLLFRLQSVKEALDRNEIDRAKELVDGLLRDTQSDIEA